MDESHSNTIERIIWACRKINKANHDVIKILQESTIANIRAIERNSRSMKDPNPLMSAMTNINLKYPITFRDDLIDKNDVPEELYSNSKDSRRYNRTLCKIDMVRWYIHNGNRPSDEIIRTIEKLFTSTQEKFKIVLQYNWSEVQFKIGTVSLQRMLIPVNPNNIDIPKDLVKSAILHALGLSNMIEYNPIPPYYLNQIHKIVKESNLDIRKIPNLLNYIQNQIDKKFRHLPILSGMTPDFVYITHALIQPQYRVQNVMEFTSEHKGQNKEITIICMNIIGFCQKMNYSYSKIRNYVNSILINDYPLKKLLYTTDENKFTRFIKGAIGIEISPLIDKQKIKYYPSNSKLYETHHENFVGTPFRRYNGEELVYFETEISKGFFLHNGDALLTITINRTNLKELSFVLSNIAIFITKGFETSKAKTLKQMKTQIGKYYENNFFELVGLNKSNVRDIKRILDSPTEEDVEFGGLRFSSNIEIVQSDPEICYIKDNSLIGSKSNQIICVCPEVQNQQLCPMSVKILDPNIYQLMHPIRLLMKAIQYNIKIVGKIKKEIKENLFKPVFPQILNYVPPSQRNVVSASLKRILKKMIDAGERNDVFICVFYNFTIGGAPTGRVREINNFIYGSDKIYLTLSEGKIIKGVDGSLKTDEETILVPNSTISSQAESVCTILPQFTITKLRNLIKGVPTKTIAWLSKNSENVPEGYKAITIFQTNYFLVIKRNNNIINTLSTLRRHVEIGLEEDTSHAFQQYLMKRKIEEIDESSSSESKRAKLWDASSVY